jgi:hypothetical protein
MCGRRIERPLKPDSPVGMGDQTLPDQQHVSPRAALSTQPCAAARLAWLLVILFPPHLLLDTTAFYKLPETTNGLLDRLAFPNVQLDHNSSFAKSRNKKMPQGKR